VARRAVMRMRIASFVVLASCSVQTGGLGTGVSGLASAGESGGDGSTETAATTDEPATDDGAQDDGAQDGSSSGSAPAESGSSSEAASSEDTTSSDASGSSDTGEPLGEWGYDNCSADCPADMCIVIQGFDGSFCTTNCIDGACPPAPDGEAVAQCLLGPDLTMPPVNCVLTCHTDAQECPTGMTCVDAMMGGNAGICLWQG
jgi:hypothetical protein